MPALARQSRAQPIRMDQVFLVDAHAMQGTLDQFQDQRAAHSTAARARQLFVQRRVNFYIKHLMQDSEGKMNKAMEWHLMKASWPCALTHSLTHPLTHLLTHFTHSLTHALAHSKRVYIGPSVYVFVLMVSCLTVLDVRQTVIASTISYSCFAIPSLAKAFTLMGKLDVSGQKLMVLDQIMIEVDCVNY